MNKRRVEIRILRKDGLSDLVEADSHKDVEGVFMKKNHGWLQDEKAGTFFTAFDIPVVSCSACKEGEDLEDEWHPFEEVYSTGHVGKPSWMKWATTTRGLAMHGRGHLMSSSTDYIDREKEGDEGLQEDLLFDLRSRSETAAFVATDPSKKKREGAGFIRTLTIILVSVFAVMMLALTAVGWPIIAEQAGALWQGFQQGQERMMESAETPTPETSLTPTEVPNATTP